MSRLPLLPLLLLLACAREPGPVPEPLSADPLASEPWRPRVAHQRCAAIPSPLSAVAELADSAALADSVRVAAPGAGSALWTIAFDANGIFADLRVLETTFDPATEWRLREAVRASLLQQSGETFIRLRLDVDRDRASRLRTGGVQYCGATLLNVDAVRLAMSAIDRDGLVELDLYVDQLGNVQERTIKLSSGDPTTDRMVLGLVGGMQYSPARLERLAIPSRLVYRVELD